MSQDQRKSVASSANMLAKLSCIPSFSVANAAAQVFSNLDSVARGECKRVNVKANTRT